MSEKTYVFDNDGGNSNNGMMGLVASLCQNRGLDPNMVAALMNNRGNGDGFGYSAWWIIILLIFGWGGFGGFGGGFGGRGVGQGLADLGNLVNNDAGRDLIMQAIQGNANAISQLASTVHCDTNQLAAAIQSVSSQICNLGNTLGLGQRDVIQQIMLGNQNIASQLCNCCCDLRQQIADFRGDIALQLCNQTNSLTNSINFVNSSVERGFAAEAYERQAQTCRLENVINAQTQAMNAGFNAIKEREDAREIQNLRDQLQACRLSDSQAAQTAAIINQLQPVAKPAYLTYSPYQSAWPYNGYPYGNNGNCVGCGNGCGCG